MFSGKVEPAKGALGDKFLDFVFLSLFVELH